MSPTEEEIADAEMLVLQFGGDTYESHKPAVRLLSWKMVSLINHIRSAEREACAKVCDELEPIGYKDKAYWLAEASLLLRKQANKIEELEKQLAAERERADFAWRNTRIIEAARQEEMRKRDVAESAMKSQGNNP